MKSYHCIHLIGYLISVICVTWSYNAIAQNKQSSSPCKYQYPKNQTARNFNAYIKKAGLNPETDAKTLKSLHFSKGKWSENPANTIHNPHINLINSEIKITETLQLSSPEESINSESTIENLVKKTELEPNSINDISIFTTEKMIHKFENLHQEEQELCPAEINPDPEIVSVPSVASLEANLNSNRSQANNPFRVPTPTENLD